MITNIRNSQESTESYTFRHYMKDVDAYLIANIGLCSSDIDDYKYMDCYSSDVDPHDCAEEAIENAGLDRND